MEIDIDTLFDRRAVFPDSEAHKRFENLVGIDQAKQKLVRTIGILVNPDGVRKWAEKFHGADIALLNYVERKPPLVILAGDVGTGKTELGTTVGDAVARQESISIALYPLSLSTRGSGMVGEMTKLLSSAFDEAVNAASAFKTKGDRANGAVILLVDEADALVQSRENSQMHHEDRAGVNAFIRGVDRLAEQHLPAVVILCTNRLAAIDPAVQRRAAEIITFERPNAIQRRSLLSSPLEEIGFTASEVDGIVEATGATGKRDYGFTYSDLTQRLLPSLVLDAYPESRITFARALELAKNMKPTAPFQESTR